ncbi:MAG: HAD family hydrolase [Candidatus Taylorbacteria bacterium]|nr:HAD family hydrolase [Candidatus Taylorbacteria bacterium]
MAQENISLVSFDMQGTLTDLSFSTCFWEETLPTIVAKATGVSLTVAAQEIAEASMEFGKNDPRFYSIEYWLKKYTIPLSAKEAVAKTTRRPETHPEMFRIVESIARRVPTIIVSTASHAFIDYELGVRKHLFAHIFSSVDDFGVGGKPPELFRTIATRLGTPISHMLHIGDDAEMDQKNAMIAGAQTFFVGKNVAERIRDLEEVLGLK